MNQRKIKVFLGGFINFTNAQNLNCLALAKHLEKRKFEVYALELYSGQLESQKGKVSGLNVFQCFRPAKISLYLGFLWGIWHCDVAYLPKGELWRFNHFLLKLLRKKSFSTMEGILDKENLASAVEFFGSYNNMMACYDSFEKKFGITHFVGQFNEEHHNINVSKKVLYLACDSSLFKNDVVRTRGLKKVVYIGRLKKRKGIYDFLKIAQYFPELDFYIFGDGEEKMAIEAFLLENKLANIQLMGIASHETLATHLKEMDLHVFPSRSEGFPKVTLETAAAGVPSVVYADYGADEWIITGMNGWVVKHVEGIISTINELKSNPNKLHAVSQEAIKLAISFDWKVKVKDWEEVIKQLYNKNK